MNLDYYINQFEVIKQEFSNKNENVLNYVELPTFISHKRAKSVELKVRKSKQRELNN